MRAALACVSVHALPLQLALREHPDWRGDPVVVVEHDKPNARIVFANPEARALNIDPGLRFLSAQALSSRLHASVLSTEATTRMSHMLLEQLRAYSPHIEPEHPGLFLLDTRGLTPLYKALRAWADEVYGHLCKAGFVAGLVVGFTRHRLLALAQTRNDALVLRTPAQEEKLVENVPLLALPLPLALARDVARLGVRTVGDFLRLDPSELRARYGGEAVRLHERLRGDAWQPLAPVTPNEVLSARAELDGASDDLTRLAFVIKGLLHTLLLSLEERCMALVGLDVVLELDHAPTHKERITPAKPTLDAAQVLNLVRLRLDKITLAAKVTTLVLTAEGLRVHPEQLLLLGRPKRDLEAAARALAQIRAAFGDDAVSIAELVPRHLPEASFQWVSANTVCEPAVEITREAPLVRQLYRAPIALPDIPTREPETWLDTYQGVVRMQGPHKKSGGWWKKPVERDYFFIETKRGDVLWVFYDRPRRRWFLQGVID